jgi:putative endonuclease
VGTTTDSTRTKGSKAEDQAVEYLIAQGYRIVTRNYQSRKGEIDCVAEDPNGTLAFVEVKSSMGPRFGHPFHRITRAKQRTIVSMARLYLAEHHIANKPCRFDAIAVMGTRIEHLRNAFLG